LGYERELGPRTLRRESARYPRNHVQFECGLNHDSAPGCPFVLAVARPFHNAATLGRSRSDRYYAIGANRHERRRAVLGYSGHKSNLHASLAAPATAVAQTAPPHAAQSVPAACHPDARRPALCNRPACPASASFRSARPVVQHNGAIAVYCAFVLNREKPTPNPGAACA
jgi:hypothetical protein